MVRRFTREEIFQRINKSLDAGKPILIAGVGSGFTARYVERGGVDFIGVYTSAYFRMKGFIGTLSYLPVGDANEIVMQLGAKEVIPQVKDAPVIAGVFASDPTRIMKNYLTQLKEVGFSGVMNFPTLLMLDGYVRNRLEDFGLGFVKEVEMIQLAIRQGLLTAAYVGDEEQTKQMAEAGADIIAVHAGATVGGVLGAKPRHMHVTSLSKAADLVQKCARVAKVIKPDVMILAHGGPISGPEDTAYIYEHTDAIGFMGASSFERIPMEKPVEENARAFKSVSFRKRKRG